MKTVKKMIAEYEVIMDSGASIRFWAFDLTVEHTFSEITSYKVNYSPIDGCGKATGKPMHIAWGKVSVLRSTGRRSILTVDENDDLVSYHELTMDALKPDDPKLLEGLDEDED